MLMKFSFWQIDLWFVDARIQDVVERALLARDDKFAAIVQLTILYYPPSLVRVRYGGGASYSPAQKVPLGNELPTT